MQRRRDRGVNRRSLLFGMPAAASVLAAACGPLQAPQGGKPVALSGTFDLLIQATFAPGVREQIPAFHQEHPQAQINVIEAGPSAELFEKIRTTTAAGTPPDGFYHYSFSWRGADAATIMLPLTPHLFRRSELERITFPSLLNSVWAKNSNEVHFLPWIVGMNASCLIYNASLLAERGIDPKGLTTLDAITTAATKLVVREGGAVSRGGLDLTWPENILQNWILDQGASFYDEKGRKWSWETAAAERALQWMLNVYERLGVAWRPGQPPPGTTNAVGQGRLAMNLGVHAGALSTFVNFPDVKVADVPVPPFAGKEPHYYVPGIAGFSLAAALKPDSAKARIGAALYRKVLTPEGGLAMANLYSGAILLKGVYTDPRFKQTKFAPLRAWDLQERVISKTVVLNLVVGDSTTQPDFQKTVLKVLAGELSIKAGLAELQRFFSVKEEETWRSLR